MIHYCFFLGLPSSEYGDRMSEKETVKTGTQQTLRQHGPKTKIRKQNFPPVLPCSAWLSFTIRYLLLFLYSSVGALTLQSFHVTFLSTINHIFFTKIFFLPSFNPHFTPISFLPTLFYFTLSIVSTSTGII